MFRHADGADHAVRRRGARHVLPRRQGDARGVSDAGRRIAYSRRDGQGRPHRTKGGRRLLRLQGGKGGHGTPDPSLADVIGPHVGKPQKMSDEQIIHRLFLPMVLEATRILAEKKVAAPQDVDLGLIFGTGFPPFKGGLLFWADTICAAKIVELLSRTRHWASATSRRRCSPVGRQQPRLLRFAGLRQTDPTSYRLNATFSE